MKRQEGRDPRPPRRLQRPPRPRARRGPGGRGQERAHRERGAAARGGVDSSRRDTRAGGDRSGQSVGARRGAGRARLVRGSPRGCPRRRRRSPSARLRCAARTSRTRSIRAPFDGVAISKDAQPGEIVSPMSAGGGFTRTGIGTIVDMSSLEIEVDVNEAFIQRVQAGQPVVADARRLPRLEDPGARHHHACPPPTGRRRP